MHEIFDTLLHEMLTSYANKSGLLNSSKSPSKELKRSIYQQNEKHQKQISKQILTLKTQN